MTVGRSPVEARHRALVEALPDLLLQLRADDTCLGIGGDISRLPDSPEVAEQLMRCVAASLEHGSLATVEGEQRDFEARRSSACAGDLRDRPGRLGPARARRG